MCSIHPTLYECELALLEAVSVKRSVCGPVSFALAFVITQAELDAAGRTLTAASAGDAMLWMVYPKGTSRGYRCEFNRDSRWTTLQRAGFGPVRMVAVDQDWSALRFRRDRLYIPGGQEMTDQAEKAKAFCRLHEPGSCFVMPNPWDQGSARLLEHLGFKALASSSAGFAFSLGRSDLSISKGSLLAHLTAVCQATQLPVSADLQNGFGNDPEDMAVTILQAAKTGIVGGSIEDASGDDGNPVYPLELAAERIRHAAVAAKSLGFKFLLTARAENYLYGRADIGDTIRRLQAYQEAGADVLFAPGVKTREEIRQIIGSIDRPLNVLAGMPNMGLRVADLQELGVTRISLGGTLARAAYGALLRAAAEVQTQGTFTYAAAAVSGQELNGIFAKGRIS